MKSELQLARTLRDAYRVGRSYFDRNAGGLDDLISAFGGRDHQELENIETGYLDAHAEHERMEATT